MVKPPADWKGRLFQIRNDYPSITSLMKAKIANGENPILPGPDTPIYRDPTDDAPWLKVDFKTDPEGFCKVIKGYIWEGNVINDFVVQKNRQRQWYHAPWMHWSQNGREPLSGLTFERPTPAKELSDKQTDELQTWACGFYNEIGATVFADIWKNKANPDWNKHVKFPKGTCVFKILMTDAKNDQVFTMTGAPSLPAVIASTIEKTGAGPRNDHHTDMRLLQVDFAVVDDRADIGWVFGTFMYNGEMKESNPWDRIMPVGIMWGNDPELTDAKIKADPDAKPQQSWIYPQAEIIRKRLNGTRPSWGWNGRMNGPADNFISACASCHSTSELRPAGKKVSMVPKPTGDMRWFRNIPAGEPFNKDSKSADYSLQLMMGYGNFLKWRQLQTAKSSVLFRTKLKVPITNAYKEAQSIDAMRQPLRASEEDTRISAQQSK
ncbi:hypothetical protein Micbo1qcDRAFT_120327 [Microdochium bolleyi]|uniref:Cytochrome c domain-containing protein n=1 Tax=Microdochium bolleyi TaxID=196109 RepID=A0A136IZJ2_9PEZI|nr:hypothetical protein Micbo1qcDRAFT_120327 [Microdochium bolleyi]